VLSFSSCSMLKNTSGEKAVFSVLLALRRAHA